MFKVGDSVLYPLYGAGVIEKVEEREILGEVRSYYIMKLPFNGMSVMIPTINNNDIGLRAIINAKTAEQVILDLPNMLIPDVANWNQRYRENMLRLKEGKIEDVAAVVKSLLNRDMEKGLSTGERKMLMSAKQVLISEIALATGNEPAEVENSIYQAAVITQSK